MPVKLNGILMCEKCYPNNERIVETSEIEESIKEGQMEYIHIELNYLTDMDITKLFMIKQLADDVFPDFPVKLQISYMPYSRMDRRISGYGFTLKYVCNLINSLNFNEVIVFDPHSDVCVGLLDRCKAVYPVEQVVTAITNFGADMILYPDAGAYKKYDEHLKLSFIPRIFGYKHRDLYTGEIIEYIIPNSDVVKDKKVIIVDDICAKGGTAYYAGKSLRSSGAKDVALYVSHCEYSIQDGKLLNTDIISKIYTTNSILQDNIHSKIIFVRGNMK